MADWESSPDYERADPRARRIAKSSVQQSKAELLQAIAARRQAQLLRSSKAPSPPSGSSFKQSFDVARGQYFAGKHNILVLAVFNCVFLLFYQETLFSSCKYRH